MPGRIYKRRIELPDSLVIEDAESAIEYAQAVRRAHARRTKPGQKQREVDIKIALERIQAAMLPIRRKAAAVAYGESTLTDEVREYSFAMQRERRKLWKMQRKRRKRKKPVIKS